METVFPMMTPIVTTRRLGTRALGLWTAVSVVCIGLLTTSAQAIPVTLDFDIATAKGGTVSYAGGSNPLVGVNIPVTNVMGIDANGNQVGGAGICINCTLSFTTGAFTSSSSVPSMWNFAGGGTITLTAGIGGGVDFNNNGIDGSEPGAGVLFAGSFGSADVLGLSGNYKIVGGSFQDTKNAQLLAFFGLPTNVGYVGAFNFTIRADANAGDSFSSTRVEGGDIVNSPTPEPGTMLLLGSGITYLAYRRRRAK